MINQTYDMPFHPAQLANFIKAHEDAILENSEARIVIQNPSNIVIIERVHHVQPAETVKEGEQPQEIAYIAYRTDDAFGVTVNVAQLICQGKEELNKAFQAFKDMLTTGTCSYIQEAEAAQAEASNENEVADVEIVQ